MRFGIFYEHKLPRPWQPESEHRLLHDALEQVELADRLAGAAEAALARREPPREVTADDVVSAAAAP